MGMNTAKMMLTGLLGGGDAGVATLEYDSDFSAWTGSWTAGATLTPVLSGTERNSTANATSDPNGNEANATSGWSASSATLASVADPSVGSYALEITATGAYGYTRANLSTAGAWCRWSFDAKRGGSGTEQSILVNSSTAQPSATVNVSTTSYVSSVIAFRIKLTVFALRAYATSASGTGVLLLDNSSHLEMTNAQTSDAIEYTANARVGVKHALTGFSQAGIMQYADANNAVVCYCGGDGKVYLEKLVGGTWSTVANVSQAHNAASLFELERLSGGTYNVYYGGTKIVDGASISDSVFDTAANWGPFATHDANTFSYLKLASA